MTELEKAWLAGFIDGEGHIGIQRVKTHGRYWFNVRMQITQTNRPVLEYIGGITGHTRIHVAHRAMKNQSTAWVWSADMTVATQVLHTVLPYLRLKKPQTILALEFAEFWYANRPKKKPRGGLAPEIDYSAFESFKNRMHILNLRGKDKEAYASLSE